MSTSIESSRLLIRKAAWAKDKGENYSQIAAQARYLHQRLLLRLQQNVFRFLVVMDTFESMELKG